MYIGKTPTVGNFQKCDAITTSATATYNLLVGGVAVSPETANHCIVSLNGVIQAPTSAFTISGSTIVFNSALTSADVIDFILLLGSVLNIGTPSDNVVSTAKIVDDAVTLAKMAAGTDGNIISYDASGNPVAIATGTSGHFLKSQGAGAQPVFAAAGGAWNFISNTTISTATTVDITSGIDSTYAVYKFLFSGVMFSTDDRKMLLQLYVGGSLDTSTDYKFSAWGTKSSNSSGIQYGSGVTSIYLNYDSNEADTDAPQDIELTLFNPSSTSVWKQVIYQSVNITHLGNHAHFIGGGILEKTAAVTGIRLLASDTGNFTAGNIRLYGISNS